MRAAWLGLGTMGLPMALNAARRGLLASAYNRRSERMDPLRRVGVASSASPRAASEPADVVVLMLTGAEAVDAVLFGPEGAATGDVRDKLFVDMSTSGRRSALSCSARLSELGARYVDAPVSGTRGPAESAELVVLAGGGAEDLARLAPLFAAVGRQTIHAGGVGAGQTLKVVLNGLGCQHLMAFASMLRLGEQAGLERQVVVDAFTQGAFSTPAYVGKRERVLAGDYGDPDFVLKLVLRDAELCREIADDLKLELPSHAAAHAEVRRAVERGLGELDLFGVERLYKPDAG